MDQPDQNTDESKGKSIPERTIETQLLLDLLLENKTKGPTMPYSVFAAKIGEPVTANSRGRGRLDSARRIARKEHSRVFSVVRGVGIVEEDSAGILLVGKAGIPKIRREARRRTKVMECMVFEELTPEQKTDALVTSSHFGVLQAITKQGAAKKLESAVQESQQKLPLALTLEAFKSKA